MDMIISVAALVVTILAFMAALFAATFLLYWTAEGICKLMSEDDDDAFF